jgi:thiamine-monophosphate kinase
MSGLELGPGREFDRIRQVVKRLGATAHDIGDDCAVLPAGTGHVVASVDLSVEGVHFRRDWITLEEIGWRAAAGALSDLAAEGAGVVGVLASVGVPPAAPDEQLVAVMAGVGAAAASVGGVVLGGDLSASPHWLINIAAIGRAERPVTRAGARPGDGLWVTGALGGSRAALEAWRRDLVPSPLARAAFAHPEPRIRAGQALARAGARAMIDLSDGLGGDAAHLAAGSGVALDIDLGALPISPAVPAAASAAGLDPAHFAALGGEDYELLVALPPEVTAGEAEGVAREAGVGLRRIGEAGKGTGARFRLRGREITLAGFDHFA